MRVDIYKGDALARLRDIPDRSVHCCITSPPYFGLRDYGAEGQIGLEATPAEFIAKLVEVFREVRRVLRDDGTIWVNMGDSYAGSWGSQGRQGQSDMTSRSAVAARQIAASAKKARGTGSTANLQGLKAKDLMMMPARLAIALCDDGWYLRQDIIWSKPNPMPESVNNRCTKSHEYLFLLAKSPRYFYDNDAIREPHAQSSLDRVYKTPDGWDTSKGEGGHGSFHKKGRKKGKLTPLSPADKAAMLFAEARRERGEDPLGEPLNPSRGGISAPGYDEKKWETRSEGLTRPPMTMKDRIYNVDGRNKRSVWVIATEAFKEAHFATFPTALVEPCIKAGTSEIGCCPDCGAPWQRISEREFTPQEDVRDPEKLKRDPEKMDSNSRWGSTQRGSIAVATVGWEKPCACPDAQPVPCTVLDPFFGAGTTALVALRLQRNCIGIEISPDYIEIARRRLISDAGMLVNVGIL